MEYISQNHEGRGGYEKGSFVPGHHTFLVLPSGQAKIKTFIYTVKQPFSGSQSPDDARVAATHKAK
jgi:hypothetical protein